jgi:cobyrinic acid a,c-diamide synthase
MTLTKQAVAERIADYLHHRISVAQLVDWAESALMEGELEEKDAEVIAAVLSRLGVADLRAFGLAWEDCEELLRQLGFSARIEIVAP